LEIKDLHTTPTILLLLLVEFGDKIHRQNRKAMPRARASHNAFFAGYYAPGAAPPSTPARFVFLLV